MPIGRFGNRKAPLAADTAVWGWMRAGPEMVTEAPGRIAPVESLTLPKISPVCCCAATAVVNVKRKTAAMAPSRTRVMDPPEVNCNEKHGAEPGPDRVRAAERAARAREHTRAACHRQLLFGPGNPVVRPGGRPEPCRAADAAGVAVDRTHQPRADAVGKHERRPESRHGAVEPIDVGEAAAED